MEYKDLKEGYYWVHLHPIFEEDNWTVGYYDGNGWYLLALEGKNSWDCIKEVGKKIKYPKK